MLNVDAEGLAHGKKGEYLDLLVRSHRAEGEPSLTERLATVLRDARAQYPAPYIDLRQPVPWSDAVMLRIAFRGPRRSELADMIAFVGRHPVLKDLQGEIVAAPRQSSGIDKPGFRGVSGGLRLRDRELVVTADYPPADTPLDLVERMLEWADIGRDGRSWISIWNRDRRVDPSVVLKELGGPLRWTSNVAVVSLNHGVFRRVVFNRDCILATASCSNDFARRPEDAERRRYEVDRFADLFLDCRHWLSFAAVNPSGMHLLDWSTFLPTGPEPPHGSSWSYFLDAPETAVPDVFALQLLTPAQARVDVPAEWAQETTDDGYRIVRARDQEPWLAGHLPNRGVLAAGREVFDSLIARPPGA